MLDNIELREVACQHPKTQDGQCDTNILTIWDMLHYMAQITQQGTHQQHIDMCHHSTKP